MLHKVFKDNYEIVNYAENPSIGRSVLRQKGSTDESAGNLKARINYATIVVKYDSVVITNSKNHTRTMKDVFLNLAFDTKGRLTLGFTGGWFGVLRTTMSPKEFSHNFVHAHGGGAYSFLGTCIGSGPIANSIASLHHNFDPIVFQAFLVALKAHLEWENDQDGYAQLSHVNERSEAAEPVKMKGSVLNKILLELKKTDLKHTLKVSVSRGVAITPTLEFERILGGIVHKIDKNMSCLRSPAGVYHPSNARAKPLAARTQHAIAKKTAILKFKGKNQYLKIENVISDEKKRKEFYANPSVTKCVCNELARQVRVKIAASKGADKKGAASNSAKTAKSDNSLV